MDCIRRRSFFASCPIVLPAPCTHILDSFLMDIWGCTGKKSLRVTVPAQTESALELKVLSNNNQWKSEKCENSNRCRVETVVKVTCMKPGHPVEDAKEKVAKIG